MPAPGYYYLSPDHRPVGPHEAPVLIALRMQGVIGVDTLISRPGDAAWRPLAEWPELCPGDQRPLLSPESAPLPPEGTYRMNPWFGWFFALLVLGFIGLIVMLGTSSHIAQNGNGLTSTSLSLLLAGGIVGLGAFAAMIWTGRIIIESDRIIEKSCFSLKVFPFEGIAGIRVLKTRNGKYLLFIPKDPAGRKLRISQSFGDWDRIFAWAAARFGNLDEINAAEITRKIVENANLGGTPEIRARRLAQAQVAGRVLTGLAFALLLWGMLYPRPYRPVILSLGSAALLLPAVLFLAFRGYVTLAGPKSDPRPKLAPLAILPLFGLFLRAVGDIHLLGPWRPVVIPCLCAGVAGILLLRPLLSEKQLAMQALFALLGAVLFYGPLAESNVLLDRSPVVRTTTSILAMNIVHGSKGGIHYKIEVLGWAGHPGVERFEVSRQLYRQVQPYHPIVVVSRKGAWGLPWGYLRPAPPVETAPDPASSSSASD